MRWLCLKLIRAYQLAIAPFLGSCCRFVPSCSEYAYEAIETHGSIKGCWMAAKRIVKCGPWHRGGYDPVKPKDP